MVHVTFIDAFGCFKEMKIRFCDRVQGIAPLLK